jgi:hypothetical protein
VVLCVRVGWFVAHTNVSRLIVVDASASSLGDRWVFGKVVCFVSPICIASSR